MNKYKIVIAYDGTNYGGWQVQPNSISIQTLVQKALETVTRHPIELTGAGRTDAGVHALGQTAHFSCNTGDMQKLLHSVNCLLPAEIRLREIDQVPEDFHARYSAKGKIYHYHLHLDRVLDPFKRLYSFHVFDKVSIPLFKEAALAFVGTHDFLSFANESHKGSASIDAVRTLKRLDVIEEKGGIRLEFEGDGFLYKMVRNIVGTLIDVAAKRIPIERVPEILKEKDRKKAGFTAPAHGLFLIRVLY